MRPAGWGTDRSAADPPTEPTPAPAEGSSPRQITNAIGEDQRRRWELGERVRAEGYFERYPSVRREAECAVDVVYGEFLLREERGESPTADEYAARFPDLAAALERQITLHRALERLAPGLPAAETDARSVSSPPSGGETQAAAWQGFPHLGNYTIARMIGQGGMGTVFQAMHRRMNRVVAVKVLSPSVTRTREMLERFEREVQTAARLIHPNIVTAYDADQSRGIHFLVMEYVDGVDLARYVGERGRLPFEHVIDLIQQAARGLAYAHGRGVVHRDIKPANLMLDARGTLRILDLGLARADGPALAENHAAGGTSGARTDLTQAGWVVGTVDYMAPEQAADAKDADPRSDIYSLGCTLFFLLTARPPYAGQTSTERLQAHRHGPVPALRAARPDVPDELDRVFRRMVAKNPAERYASMNDLVTDLDACRLALQPSRTARPLFRRRSLAAPVVLAAALVLAGLGIAGHRFWWQPAPAHADPDASPLLATARPAAGAGTDPAGQAEAANQAETARRQWAELREQWAGVPLTDPVHPGASLLRGRLQAFWHEHRATPPGREAVRFATQLVWPCDLLRQEGIAADEWRAAADRLPASSHLVAIQGDSRLMAWGAVFALAFSLDGQLIASGDMAGELKLWDAASGRARHTLNTGRVYALAFNGDSSRVASAGSDGTVTFWDTATGARLESLDTGWAHAIALAPNGEAVATCNSDKTIQIWEVPGGRLRRTLVGHADSVRAVAFSPDGGTIASASFDRTVRLWDAATGEERRRLDGHADQVHTVAFSAQGDRLASGSSDGTVRLWNAHSGEELHTCRGHGWEVHSVAFSPDGKTVASAGLDRTVRLWAVETGMPIQTLTGHIDSVLCVAFGPDGRTLASGGWDGGVQLWDLARGEPRIPHDQAIGKLAAVAFSPDGDQLAAGTWSGTIRIWDLSAPGPGRALEGHGGWVRSLVFRSGGTSLLSGSDDRTVRSWDLGRGQSRVLREGLTGEVRAVATSPDQRWLAAGLSDGSMFVCDASDGGIRHALAGHSRAVQAVAFSPNGRVLASGSEDRTVKLWNVADGKEITTWASHPAAVQCLVFSPDGKRLAVGGGELWQPGFLHLWDVHAGRLHRALEGHTHLVRSVDFRSDGAALVSAADDGRIRVWDAETETLLDDIAIGPPSGAIWHVVFSPEGRHIATANGNGTAYVLRLRDR